MALKAGCSVGTELNPEGETLGANVGVTVDEVVGVTVDEFGERTSAIGIPYDGIRGPTNINAKHIN